MKSKKIIIPALIVAIAVLLLLPQILTSRYQMRIIDLVGIYIILVLGMNVLYGLAGQLSFGQAGFFAIGAYCVGVLTVQWGLSPWIGFLAAAVVTTIFGIFVGIPTLRIKGHYLVVATIAFGEIVRHIINNWEKVTRGYNGIMGIKPPTFGTFTPKGEFQIYYIILVFVLLAIFIAWRIKYSTFGRVMVAVKNSEIAAEAMGVDSTRIKVLAFATSALFAGVAGALYSYLFGYISPDAFEFQVSINIVAMLLVGGPGSTFGAILGAAALTVLPEFLRVSKGLYMVLYGAVILLILIFLPKGVYGVLKDGIKWLVSRVTQKEKILRQADNRLP